MARTPSTNISTRYETDGALFSETNSQLLLSQRGTRDSSATTDLSGISLYTPYVIPSQFVTSPNALLNYFKDTLGATVSTGVDDTINFVAPDSASVATVNGQDLTTLVWNTKPEGWDDISGITVVGTATQSTATGTIFSVSSSGYSIVLSSVTNVFDNVNPVTLAYTNKSVTLPDGNSTESFVLDAYYAAAELATIESTVNVNVTIPTVTLIFTSDRDSLFEANPAPLSLDTVDTVIDNGDGTLRLVWDTEPANWKYVPENGLGNSFVEGATPADTAIIEQEQGSQYSPSGDGFVLLVTPAAGASFVDNDPITMTLDDTVSLFDQLEPDANYKIVSVHYELTDTTEITSASGELALLTQYLALKNASTNVTANNSGAIGCVGMTTLTVQESQTLAAVDSNQYMIPNMYYKQTFNDPTIGGGELAASFGAMVAANEVPFTNQNGFVLGGFPVSSDSSTYLNVSATGDSEELLDKGFAAIGVTSNREAFAVSPITTQITVPGSGEPDDEWYTVHAQQVIIELKNRTYAISQQPSLKDANITSSLLTYIAGNVYGMLVQAENEGMVNNVDSLKSSIVVSTSPSEPNTINISYDINITDTLVTQNYTINIASSVVILTTAA